MKAFRVWLMALVLAIGSGLAVPGPASAAPYCGLVWGSLLKSDPAMSEAKVVNIRSGQHYCFDRLVVDLEGTVAGYTARYVPQVVQNGSGFAVPLRGNAFIQLTVNSPSYDEDGNATYTPANKAELTDVTGYQTFRQVATAGSYEGYTSVGIGVRGRLPFRVFTLAGPGTGSRLVIDVAHFW